MSQDYKITVKIFCRSWDGNPKIYRIFIDDELLTERTYIWVNPEQHIQEIIIVNLDQGKHTFKLESVDPNFVGFNYLNFRINDQLVKLSATGEFTI